jgi:O-antigen ligase
MPRTISYVKPDFGIASATVYTGPRPSKRTHPLEAALVSVAGLELCVLPWAFGGVDPAVQVACAAVSLCALLVALSPRRTSAKDGSGRRYWLQMWPRLTAFPVFWAGLALFAYVAVQACNASYSFRTDSGKWWLEPRAHIPWLPSGMEVPFGDMNAWRMLLIWGSAWALTCALWVGVTRRNSIVGLLMAIELNAFGFAVFGIIQRASGAVAIYASRAVNHPDFFAAIIYRNHAAALFSLLACVTLGMTIRAFWIGRNRQDPSGPGVIHMLFALTVVVALVLSGSFAAAGLFIVMLALVLPVTIWRYLKMFRGPGGNTPVLMAAGALLVFAVGLGVFVGYDGLKDRVERLANGGGRQAARIRFLADKRGFEMFEDRWLTGWGAGAFRYGFTKYQRREQDLEYMAGDRVRWEHVHDDWLELLIELGVFGAVPVAVMLGYWTVMVAKLRLWRRLAALPILGGLVLLAVHAFVDFPLQNLAILVTATALLPLVVRWGEIEGEAA